MGQTPEILPLSTLERQGQSLTCTATSTLEGIQGHHFLSVNLNTRAVGVKSKFLLNGKTIEVFYMRNKQNPASLDFKEIKISEDETLYFHMITNDKGEQSVKVGAKHLNNPQANFMNTIRSYGVLHFSKFEQMVHQALNKEAERIANAVGEILKPEEEAARKIVGSKEAIARDRLLISATASKEKAVRAEMHAKENTKRVGIAAEFKKYDDQKQIQKIVDTEYEKRNALFFQCMAENREILISHKVQMVFLLFSQITTEATKRAAVEAKYSEIWTREATARRQVAIATPRTPYAHTAAWHSQADTQEEEEPAALKKKPSSSSSGTI